MKVLLKGDAKVIGIVGKMNVDPNAEYRVSDHVLLYSKNDRHLARQVLTCQSVRLTDEEYAFLTSAKERGVTGRKIIDAGYDELVKLCYLVLQSSDDCAEYLKTLSLLKMMKRSKPGISTYTILPTTACNARCFYCYEEGFKPIAMDRRMADHVIDFICRTKQDEKITLKWFGGEPLLSSGIISHICSSLEERGVEYRSDMTTNASLFSRDLVREAKTVWHLERVQVSLDGHRSDYEARKRYIDPVKFNYDTVMRAVHYLLDENVNVIFRCNFDEENLPRLDDFITDLANEFGGDKKPEVYMALLYQKRIKADSIKLYEREIELREKLDEFGFKTGKEISRKTMKLNSCMADSDGKSVVINADGKLYLCEHLVGEAGSIFDNDGEAFRASYRSATDVAEECRHCTFLPLCTPFRKAFCPNAASKVCAEMRRINEIRALERIAKLEKECR